MARKKDGKLPNPVNYSLWLLNFKPRSVKEMTLALKKRGFSDEVAEETVESLLRWKYIDDAQFADYLIGKRKRGNAKGRSFVLRELSEAGIDEANLPEDFYTDEEEYENILRQLQKWCPNGKNFAENKNRYFQRLYRRGFSAGNIKSALSTFESEYAEQGEYFDYDDFPEN